MTRKSTTSLTLIVLILAAAAFAPLPLAAADRIVIALALVSAVCWTLEPISIELTALCLLLAIPLTGIATFDTTFAAFGRPAVWLVFAGMVISQLITETRLGNALSRLIVGRIHSPVRLILELSLLGIALAVLIPSGVVRVLIILPVLVALVDALGADRKSPLAAAIILSVVCATYYGGTGILTASVPNLVIMGVLEARGRAVYWAEWALHVFPVIGFLRVIAGAAIVWLLFLPRLPARRPPVPDPVTLGSREVRAAAILLAGVAGWGTDTFHGVHPVIVGLVLTIVSLTPGIGPLSADSLRKVNYPILIYIGSVFALGEAMVTAGTSDRLAAALTEGLRLADRSVFGQLSAITYVVTPFNFLVDTAVVGGVLTPPLLQAGAAAGLDPLQVGLSVAVGTGMVFVPYQGAPFMIAYAYGYVSMRQFVSAMVGICLLNLVLLVPLNLLYWRWIGLF